MGLKIADILKWRTSVILNHPSTGNPLLDDKGKVVEVYLRIIGDEELEIAHRKSRLASAEMRKTLLDKDSDAYKDRVAPIMDATKEDCMEVMKQYRTSNLDAEARVNVVREELPTIEEFALLPDAPTLEEQEKLDKAITDQEERHEKALKDYIDARTSVIVAELGELSEEEIREFTRDEIVGVIALAQFINELVDQKVSMGAYLDKTFKERAYDNVQEFKDEVTGIRQQLIDAYLQLEQNPDSVKK